MEKTVTALKQQKRNPQRVNVYLDGEFAFGLAKIVAAWLQVGKKISPDKISELQAKDEVEVAYLRALNFLSYRPRSRAEVEKNLRKHEVAEACIEDVIERLERNKLVDDRDFAARWVENRSTFRPRGTYALRSELRQKGVADEVVEQALKDIDEEELAYKAAQKKIRRYQELEWNEFRKKLSAFLARRGFSYDLIKEVCQTCWQELERERQA